jgi:threonine dehydratase
MYLPSLAELDAAAATVYGAMPATPQFSWPLLNAALGAQAWVKHENYTLTGANVDADLFRRVLAGG